MQPEAMTGTTSSSEPRFHSLGVLLENWMKIDATEQNECEDAVLTGITVLCHTYRKINDDYSKEALRMLEPILELEKTGAPVTPAVQKLVSEIL
jgi:hypothetical protein